MSQDTGLLFGSAVELTGAPPAVRESTSSAMALLGGGVSTGFIGMEGLRPSDLGLRAPRLQLIHKIDDPKDAGKPGWYRLGSAALEKVEMVVLRPAPFRTLQEGEGKDTRTVCASADGHVPHAEVAAPKDVACNTCAYGQWDTDPATGKRVPPKCQEGLALLAVLPGAGDAPVVFPCKGRYARAAVVDFLQNAVTTPMDGNLRGFFRFRVELTSKRMTDDSGKFAWYVPVFASRLCSEAESVRYARMAEAAVDFQYVVPCSGQVQGPVQTQGATVPGGPSTVSAEVLTNGVPF